MEQSLFTVGHSTHSGDALVALLKRYDVTAVADVRSSPYSAFSPQFNREVLSELLDESGIAYVFLGDQLGARPTGLACMVEGRVDFGLLAATARFQKGLERLRAGMAIYRVALLCAEKDPIACHRTILVCRHFRGNGTRIGHILADGELEQHEDAERRLMAISNVPEADLFMNHDQLLDMAYERQGARIAYAEKDQADND